MSARTGPKAAGRILAQSAEELTRIWRLARASSRRQAFPGLLDGVVPSFLAEAGRILAEGGPPEAVWPAVAGTLRLSPSLGPAELTAEWAVAMEVLAAVCESFGSEPAVAEWLARAVADAERGSTALANGGGASRPPGLLLLRVLGEMSPPKRVLRAAGEDA